MAPSNRLCRRADAPCSALCLNCLQLSCCIPRLSLDEFKDLNCEPSSLTFSWMSLLPPETKLRALILPGTHDSASYTIPAWKPFSAVARTQNFTIYEQLLAGVRFLDLRLAPSTVAAREISIWHGCLEGTHLQEVIEQIQEFCQEHTSEFIIVELVPEFGRPFSGNLKKRALELFHNVLGEECILDDPNDVIENWTVGDVVNKNRQLLVLVHARFFEETDTLDSQYVRAMYGFHASQHWMRSKWHNTRAIEGLKKSLLEDVKKNERQGSELWFCSQMILTPGVPDARHMFMALIGRNSLRPVSLACKLYDEVGVFMRQHANEDWNVIILDYVDLGSDLAHFLVSLNMPCKVRVGLAVLDRNGSTRDVTTKVQGLIARDRVLYLSGPSDVGAISGDKLTIAYKTGETYKLASCPMELGQSIIIGQFCSSCQGTIVEKSTSGYFCNGNLYPQKPTFKVLPSAVVRFLHDGTNCDFEIA